MSDHVSHTCAKSLCLNLLCSGMAKTNRSLLLIVVRSVNMSNSKQGSWDGKLNI